jgi:hypothetical protein
MEIGGARLEMRGGERHRSRASLGDHQSFSPAAVKTNRSPRHLRQRCKTGTQYVQFHEHLRRHSPFPHMWGQGGRDLHWHHFLDSQVSSLREGAQAQCFVGVGSCSGLCRGRLPLREKLPLRAQLHEYLLRPMRSRETMSETALETMSETALETMKETAASVIKTTD